MFEWDFSEFNDFKNQLGNTYKLETTLMTATQAVARALHQQLLINTPIDTGNLRKMWSAGDNLKFTVIRVNNGFEVTMINMAQNEKGERYGRWVNDGHKTPSGNGWVMGRFFVERSIVQVADSAKLETLVMNELQKWWDSV